VAIKLFSHPNGLAFHHKILTCQVWARGSKVINQQSRQAYTPSQALKKYGIGLPKKETLRSSTERFWVKKFPGIKQ
jgi:hypothetical protein